MRRAFGLRGELFVEPLTNEPGDVFAPGRVIYTDGGARSLRIDASRPFKDGWLVKLDGVADRTAADAWRGTALLAPLDTLRPPEGNELYLHEITGMRVSDEPHGELGTVAGWYPLPQGIVLEVRGAAWRADIPFNEAFIESVDRAARTMTVRLPEGLVEPAD